MYGIEVVDLQYFFLINPVVYSGCALSLGESDLPRLYYVSPVRQFRLILFSQSVILNSELGFICLIFDFLLQIIRLGS